MGVLTDVFIASTSEVTERIIEQGPQEQLPMVEGKGFDVNAIARLAEVLELAPPPQGPPYLEPFGESRDGTCVLRLSDAIVSAIARATDERLAEIRDAWHGPEQPDGLGMKSDAQIWFEDFVVLLKAAATQGKGAFVWMCP
jgi:hypothetical protein